MIDWQVHPRTVDGINLNLEPLNKDHISDLCDCLLGEPDGWFARMYGINNPEILSKALLSRLNNQPNKTSMSFVMRDKNTNQVAGLSHFMKIDENNKQLEIGGTQIGQQFRRTHVNTEAKLLMLQLAFEEFDFVRIYFKIDTDNAISQRAIARIGAVYEGELRNDAVLPDGRLRTYQIYSILNSEWPKVKENLLRSLKINRNLEHNQYV